MRITVADSVNIEQPDDLTAFSVATDLPLSELDARLRAAGLGSTAGEHAWIEVEALRHAASALTSAPDWNEGYDRMVDYARGKGWLDAAGTAIRAHIAPLG